MSVPAQTRLLSALAGLAPPMLLLTVYWPGLWTWFHTDDFSLLWMARLPAHEFWGQLFEPRAQGTYRWLSERLYFYLLYQEFGWNAFPYRVVAFATQIVNLWLLVALVRRLGGSLAVGGGAAALWAVHHGMAVSMSWSSAYNQVLCAMFLLTALLAFIRFTRTGGIGWYTLQWLLFLVGFGALETIAVYPVLALLYCLLFARSRWAWPLPMLLGSAAMVWFQLGVAGDRGGSLYRPSLAPADLVGGLLHYVGNVSAGHVTAPAGLLVGAATLAAAIWAARRGDWTPAFGWGWFLVTLTPYLPLAEHRSDYYLAIPAAGAAVAFAGGVRAIWSSGWALRAVAATTLAVHLYGAVSFGLDRAESNWARSIRCRNMITGLAHVRAEHPRKTIVLTGFDNDFFYGSIYQDILPLAEIYDVYLAPDANSVRQWPGYRPIGRWFLTDQQALLGIARDTILVYDVSGFRLREVTRAYKRYAPLRLAPPQGAA